MAYAITSACGKHPSFKAVPQGGCNKRKVALITDIALVIILAGVGTLALLKLPLIAQHCGQAGQWINTLSPYAAWTLIGAGGAIVFLDLLATLRRCIMACRNKPSTKNVNVPSKKQKKKDVVNKQEPKPKSEPNQSSKAPPIPPPPGPPPASSVSKLPFPPSAALTNAQLEERKDALKKQPTPQPQPLQKPEPKENPTIDPEDTDDNNPPPLPPRPPETQPVPAPAPNNIPPPPKNDLPPPKNPPPTGAKPTSLADAIKNPQLKKIAQTKAETSSPSTSVNPNGVSTKDLLQQGQKLKKVEAQNKLPEEKVKPTTDFRANLKKTSINPDNKPVAQDQKESPPTKPPAPSKGNGNGSEQPKPAFPPLVTDNQPVPKKKKTKKNIVEFNDNGTGIVQPKNSSPVSNSPVPNGKPKTTSKGTPNATVNSSSVPVSPVPHKEPTKPEPVKEPNVEKPPTDIRFTDSGLNSLVNGIPGTPIKIDNSPPKEGAKGVTDSLLNGIDTLVNKNDKPLTPNPKFVKSELTGLMDQLFEQPLPPGDNNNQDKANTSPASPTDSKIPQPPVPPPTPPAPPSSNNSQTPSAPKEVEKEPRKSVIGNVIGWVFGNGKKEEDPKKKAAGSTTTQPLPPPPPPPPPPSGFKTKAFLESIKDEELKNVDIPKVVQQVMDEEEKAEKETGDNGSKPPPSPSARPFSSTDLQTKAASLKSTDGALLITRVQKEELLKLVALRQGRAEIIETLEQVKDYLKYKIDLLEQKIANNSNYEMFVHNENLYKQGPARSIMAYVPKGHKKLMPFVDGVYEWIALGSSLEEKKQRAERALEKIDTQLLKDIELIINKAKDEAQRRAEEDRARAAAENKERLKVRLEKRAEALLKLADYQPYANAPGYSWDTLTFSNIPAVKHAQIAIDFKVPQGPSGVVSFLEAPLKTFQEARTQLSKCDPEKDDPEFLINRAYLLAKNLETTVKTLIESPKFGLKPELLFSKKKG